jgi:PAS domain S-box-containing protein
MLLPPGRAGSRRVAPGGFGFGLEIMREAQLSANLPAASRPPKPNASATATAADPKMRPNAKTTISSARPMNLRTIATKRAMPAHRTRRAANTDQQNPCCESPIVGDEGRCDANVGCQLVKSNSSGLIGNANTLELTSLPLFTFYCCKEDGAATTFEARELASKYLAHVHAQNLLEEHKSCSHVTVFDGDVEVLTARRSAVSSPHSPPLSVAEIDPLGLATALDSLAADRRDISLIATTADGAVAYWNRAASRLYGWSFAEAFGRNVVDLKATEDSREVANDIMRTLQSGRSWAGEINLRKRNGVEFSAYVADIPLGAVEDGAGLIVGASAEASRREAVMAFEPDLLAALRHNVGRRRQAG